MNKYILALVLLTSCESAQKGTVVDLLTPDSVGVGASESTLDGFGLGNKTMRNQEQPLELDFEGESKSTSIFLTWDLPEFKDIVAENKETRRNREIAFISDTVTNLQETAAYQMERDVEISQSHEELVDSFLVDSDKKEQQIFAVSKKVDEVNATLKRLEDLTLYNVERLQEVENLIPAATVVTPSMEQPPVEPAISLEKNNFSAWMWALTIVLFFINAYVIFKVFFTPSTSKYVPVSEVKKSLEWLDEDLIKKEIG